MNFYAEIENRKQRNLLEIAQLVDEYYQLSHQAESIQKRLAEIDKFVEALEYKVRECEQSQRDFNSYLAVKEGAITFEQLKDAIENGTNLEVPEKNIQEVKPKCQI